MLAEWGLDGEEIRNVCCTSVLVLFFLFIWAALFQSAKQKCTGLWFSGIK